MDLRFNYTPKTWEFGLGFGRATEYLHPMFDEYIQVPAEFYIMLGPVSISLIFLGRTK